MVSRQDIFALRNQIRRQSPYTRCSFHRLNRQVIAAHPIDHHHIKRRCRRPFFIKTAYMEARRMTAPMNNLMNRSLIPVKSKHYWLISCEMFHKDRLLYTMWMEEWWIE